LNTNVAVTAVAVWTPGGVWINAPPLAGPEGGTLAAWPEAPPLAVVHPRARRPHREATVLVQLAHALLSARASIGTAPPPHGPAQTDLLLGTATASEAADMDFLRDLRQRGSGFGSPSTFVYTLSTAAPAEVAIALGLRGSLATITAGSISGLSAVVRATRRVTRGESLACITGGVELVEPAAQAVAEEPASEVAALFLLEPSTLPLRGPTIGDTELGFEPTAPARDTGKSASPIETLLSLASACVERRETSPIEITGRSREGHWARLRVQW
jgi:hypothetical protein